MPKRSVITSCDVCMHPLQSESELALTVTCQRCGKHHNLRPKSAQLTFIYSLTALVFFIPANFFPFMTMELYGDRTSSTIWGGVVSLAQSDSLFLAIVVFLASIFIPLVKLTILFYLSATAGSNRHHRFKTKLYQTVEAIGRWSMLDIFLLAILVAMIKLGHWTRVEPEIGAVIFSLVVIFTLMASANFDPKLIWENYNEENNN